MEREGLGCAGKAEVKVEVHGIGWRREVDGEGGVDGNDKKM